MKELFLISGLGADRRVFVFLDLSEYKLNHVEWIQPLSDESIEQYATRLLKQIPAVRPMLVGVSFGGIMAVEIAKQIETEKVILISSARTRSELPGYFRLTGKLNVHKILPTSIQTPPGFIVNYLFGVKTQSEKKLLKTIVQETDPVFLNWAIDKIVNWKNKELLPNVITIHGRHDRIFPKQKADYVVESGGHFMIVSQATEVSRFIKKAIRN
jgi:pimeloyl-ACP methyl ester carboxylesterase